MVQDVERLAREIVDGALPMRPNCAARTVIADITPIVEISQRTGLPIEAAASSARPPSASTPRTGPSITCEADDREAVAFAVKEGLPVIS